MRPDYREVLQSPHWSKICRLKMASAKSHLYLVIFTGLQTQNSVWIFSRNNHLPKSETVLLNYNLRGLVFFWNKEMYLLMTGNFFVYNPRQVLKQGILLEKVSQRYTCPEGGRKIKIKICFFSFKSLEYTFTYKLPFLLSFHPPC